MQIIQSLCACSCEAAGILKQELLGPQQVQTVHQGPSNVQNDDGRIELEVEPQKVEECMDAFLSVAEEFTHLFHQVCHVVDEGDFVMLYQIVDAAALALSCALNALEVLALMLFLHQIHSLPCCCR